jgi:hypothetical protein
MTRASSCAHDDALREDRIEICYRALIAAPSREERTLHWRIMRGLILGRSPEQARKMELERGLL